MAVTYTWEVGALDTYPTASDSQDPVNTQNDVIYNIHWKLKAEEGDSGYGIIGTQTVSTEDLSSFTSFDSLDQDTVVGWLTASLEAAEEGKVEALKSSASASLAEKINPSSVVKYLS